MMMKLPYGIANFETIRTEDYFYVDKTPYLELLEGLPERYLGSGILYTMHVP
ncbi:hypothetical protein U27_06492 [Candidatus Vecturithrix granuli]|uniref:AAA-ATPase-like domain-containing protein n=1 Tax=Vecturithrix granuli TaxID=1499967 RepID=A0A081C4K2_VECG1|nr:hypothetical protein U27_06492 [Candidatus Vecturithrix granuli]